MFRYTPRRVMGVSLLALAPLVALGDEFQTPAIVAAEVQVRQGTPDALLVVDVRPNGEYKSGHIAGAVNIPYTKVDQHLDELRKAKGVVLYCTQGHRTRQAEQTLLDHQVPNLFHLEGGLGAWQQGGYEIHTGWGP
jgi:rhodanese-related sulfurtransferase